MGKEAFKMRVGNSIARAKVAIASAIFDEALDGLEKLVPEGRIRSIIQTKMQEAFLFATQDIVNNPANNRDPEDAQP